MNDNVTLARCRMLWCEIRKEGLSKRFIIRYKWPHLRPKFNCFTCQQVYDKGHAVGNTYGANEDCNIHCLIKWDGGHCLHHSSSYMLRNIDRTIELIDKAIAKYDKENP